VLIASNKIGLLKLWGAKIASVTMGTPRARHGRSGDSGLPERAGDLDVISAVLA
jgi:hypothetical protein